MTTTITGCSCGACCGQSTPCDRCLEDTLAANGIPLYNIERFKGLKNKGGAYAFHWEFSELCKSIRAFNKERRST